MLRNSFGFVVRPFRGVCRDCKIGSWYEPVYLVCIYVGSVPKFKPMCEACIRKFVARWGIKKGGKNE